MRKPKSFHLEVQGRREDLEHRRTNVVAVWMSTITGVRSGRHDSAVRDIYRSIADDAPRRGGVFFVWFKVCLVRG